MTEKSKEKLKDRMKVLTASSPALTALFLYPTETFAFLKMLKEAGLELPSVLFIGAIAWWPRKDVVRIVDGRLKELNDNVKQVSESLSASNDQNSKEFQEGRKIMQAQGQQIRFIMTHLQLNAPEHNEDPTEEKP